MKENKRKKPEKLLQKHHIRRGLLIIPAGIAVYTLIISFLLSMHQEERYVRATGQTEGRDLLEVQPALAGLLDSVDEMKSYYQNGQMLKVSTPGEEVLAGVRSVNRNLTYQNTFRRYAQRFKELGYEARQVVSANQLPYQEYYTLLQIVEAEATGGDVKSKLLIADVVLNRVEDERFPDTITGVVWQNVDGFPQFSPTADGRIGNLTITDSTIEAVKRALDGENIAKGALFFVARSSASGKSLKWFDDSLVYLFEYGGHAFYKFPEQVTTEQTEEPEELTES